MGMKIDGRKIAASIKEKVRSKVTINTNCGNRAPHLAVILVGNNPASIVYVRNKERSCQQVGITSTLHQLPENTTAADLAATIVQLNNDTAIDGILLQLPLPNHLDALKMITYITPHKDVDGLTFVNQGKLSMQDHSGMCPCTPKGIMHIFSALNYSLAGKNAVVMGRSILVGNPIARLLQNANATVTQIHSHTINPTQITKQADVLIVAVGKPQLVTASWIKEGAIVIDVGINNQDNKLVGDVDYENSILKAYAITPVPGGVGPLTVASLLENCLTSYLQQLNS